MKKYKFKHKDLKKEFEVEAEDANRAWFKFMSTPTYRMCPVAQKTGGGFSFWVLENGNERK